MYGRTGHLCDENHHLSLPDWWLSAQNIAELYNSIIYTRGQTV
jgi:hypothetical protein